MHGTTTYDTQSVHVATQGKEGPNTTAPACSPDCGDTSIANESTSVSQNVQPSCSNSSSLGTYVQY